MAFGNRSPDSLTRLRQGRETPNGLRWGAFDRSALRAVADASPLPPLPLEWREPTLAAAFVFRADIAAALERRPRGTAIPGGATGAPEAPGALG